MQTARQNSKSNFAHAWRDYRSRWAMFFVAFFGCVLGMITVIIWGNFKTPFAGEKAIFTWLFLVLFFSYVICAFRLAAFRCPNCNNPFFGSTILAKPWFRANCPHCGLTTYAVNF